jgi:hypothetical protein
MRVQLTTKERIIWFVRNYYETGMELDYCLDKLKDADLDNFHWYGKRLVIPKYKDEIKQHD